MAYYIFCEIAWMRYYNGVTEDDKPRNGGKFIAENGEGGEVFNFSPYNHKCYGYVMHYGDEMHIERFDKKLKNSTKVENVTVVWVASDGTGCYIVGWYENAEMYRYWQGVYIGGEAYDYNFLAHEKDCYLIPENKRTFKIPRAPKAGKGRGMGQSQVWYPESAYAQMELIPKVQAYMNSVRGKCKPFYPSEDELTAKAKNKGQTTDELIAAMEQEQNFLKALLYINLAVEKDDCYRTRLKRGTLLAFNHYLDEAEEDLKTALHYEEGLVALSNLMKVESDLCHEYLAIELGEKIHDRKKEDENWVSDANLLAALYTDEGEYEKAESLMRECETEENAAEHEEWIENLRNFIKEKSKK